MSDQINFLQEFNTLYKMTSLNYNNTRTVGPTMRGAGNVDFYTSGVKKNFTFVTLQVRQKVIMKWRVGELTLSNFLFIELLLSLFSAYSFESQGFFRRGRGPSPPIFPLLSLSSPLVVCVPLRILSRLSVVEQRIKLRRSCFGVHAPVVACGFGSLSSLTAHIWTMVSDNRQ